MRDLPGVKKPSSKLPPRETMVWFPVRDWPEGMVSVALQRCVLQENNMKRVVLERKIHGIVVKLAAMSPEIGLVSVQKHSSFRYNNSHC